MNRLEKIKDFVNGHKKLIVILTTIGSSFLGLPPEVMQAVMFYLAGQSGVDIAKALRK